MDPLGALTKGVVLKPQTTADGVAAVLREAIASGLLAPASVLRQDDLAARFGVSRMPVRDALRLLEAEGIVSIHPTRGAFVAGMDPVEIREIYAVRILLEGEALRLALELPAQEEFDRAAAILDRIDQERDVGRWGTLNREFHLTLYRGCHNRRLLDLIEVQHNAADRYVRILLSNLDYRSRSQDEHRALLEACRKGDSASAQIILSTHLGEGCRTLIDSMKGR